MPPDDGCRSAGRTDIGKYISTCEHSFIGILPQASQAKKSFTREYAVREMLMRLDAPADSIRERD